MKKSYHSDIKVRYKLGLLDTKIIGEIPRSTLFNWRNSDLSNLFGVDSVYDNEENIDLIREFLCKKKLMEAAKILYFFNTTFSVIIKSLKNKKRVLFNVKENIVKTIDRAKDIIGLKKACKVFHITYTKYYNWKNNCKSFVIKFCRKVNPSQLSKKETDTIKKYCSDINYLNWSLSSVFYKMMRDGAAFMSLNTFYKYANILKLNRCKPENRRKKHTIGIRANTAKKILHADLTIFRTGSNTKVYIYIVADNFSRFILSARASLEYSAKMAFQNLKNAYEKFNLADCETIDLIVDDGSENKAEVDNFTAKVNLNKLVAQKDIIFSNSIIEAVNKTIKYDFLFTKELIDFEHTKSYLEIAVNEYNNKPYHPLHGLTPKEVFEGQIPDKYLFKSKLLIAKKQRIEENKQNLCANHLQ